MFTYSNNKFPEILSCVINMFDQSSCLFIFFILYPKCFFGFVQTPQDSPTVADRRPAQPRPLHPEFSSYHQPQTKSICRRPNLPNFGNDHLLPSHKVQYPPDPRFSTPTNSSLANGKSIQCIITHFFCLQILFTFFKFAF